MMLAFKSLAMTFAFVVAAVFLFIAIGFLIANPALIAVLVVVALFCWVWSSIHDQLVYKEKVKQARKK